MADIKDVKLVPQVAPDLLRDELKGAPGADLKAQPKPKDVVPWLDHAMLNERPGHLEDCKLALMSQADVDNAVANFNTVVPKYRRASVRARIRWIAKRKGYKVPANF